MLRKKIFFAIRNHYPVLTVIAVWLIFSSPYFFRGLVPFPSDYLISFFPPWNSEYAMPVKNNAMPDVVSQIFPWKKITIDTWKSGQVPLWNPYAFSGTVHAGNYQSAVFTPFNFLFFLLPFIDAWSLLILLQPLLAGLFMYLYLRDEKVSCPGSLTGAVAFMFSGFFVVWMAYGTLGYALLFLPLILWSINQIYRGQVKKGIWTGLGLALSFLSGHFQISLYVAAFAIVYALFKGLKQKFPLRFTALGILLFGLGISAIQILPTLDAYGQSARSSSFVRGEIIPWAYLPTLVAPDYYGNPVTRNDWFGHYAEWCGYVGLVSLLLALAALIGSRRRRVLFFGGAALFSFLLAYDTPLTDLMFVLKLPAVSTSAASRILSLTVFSLAALSGFGFDILEKKEFQKKFFVLYFAAIGATALSFLVYTFFLSGLAGDRLTVAVRNSLLPGAVFLTFIFLNLLRRKWPKKSIVFSGLIIALTVFELLRFAGKWMPFSPRSYVYPEIGVLNFLKENAGNGRIFGNLGGEITARINAFQVEGYDAMYKEKYGRFLIFAAGKGMAEPSRSVALVDRNSLNTKKVLDLLSVRFLVHRLSDGENIWAFPYWNYLDSFKSVYRDGSYEVFENLDAGPRARLAADYQLTNNDEETLVAMFSDKRDISKTVYLTESPSFEPETGIGKLDTLISTSNKLVFRTQTETPKLLFLNDIYDNGWQAAIDGKPTGVLRANYIFRAVAVPSGEHEVALTYFPDSFRNGLIISFGSLIGLIMISFRKRRDLG